MAGALKPPADALTALVDRAQREAGDLPPRLLARQALRTHPHATWPVQLAAYEAIVRRLRSAEREELEVASRPPRGHLGRYRTRRARSTTRPYTTEVRRLDPLDASCDCPDFLRNSLGVCKHVLVILQQFAQDHELWDAARRERVPSDVPRIQWDSTRPLQGEGDWLTHVRAFEPAGAVADEAWIDIRELFALTASTDGLEGGLRPDTWDTDDGRTTTLEAVRDALARRPTLADPALGARIEADLAQLGRERTLTESRALRHLNTLKRPLFPFQRDGVERFLRRGRLLLADDLGLGKTTQAVAIAHALNAAGLVQRGVVVAPASLKSFWAREWSATSGVPLKVIEGSPAERQKAYAQAGDAFLLVHYEQLLRDLDALLAWDPQCVILDEAQRIKNWAAKTAHAVKRLRVPYRLVLTGTPLEPRLDELASLMDWVEDFALEPKWRLVPHHDPASLEGKPGRTQDIETLRARLQSWCLRRRRAEVLDQLPSRTHTCVPVEMTSEQREAHDALDPALAELFHASRQRPLTRDEFQKLTRLLTTQRIIANGMAQLDFDEVWPTLEGARPTARSLKNAVAPKLGELRSLIRSLCVDQTRKVVVFSQWVRFLRLAQWATSDILADAELTSVWITGREGPSARARDVARFHEDDAARVCFVTDGGGVGLDLHQAASAGVHLELPWNSDVLEQRAARLHQDGQARPVELYDLTARGSVEERLRPLAFDTTAPLRQSFEGITDTPRFEHSAPLMTALANALALDDVAPTLATDESLDTPRNDEPPAWSDEDPRPIASTAPSTPASLHSLGVTVQRTDDGQIQITASPEDAARMLDALETLSRALREGLQREGDTSAH